MVLGIRNWELGVAVFSENNQYSMLNVQGRSWTLSIFILETPLSIEY
jgi:hypothetical protein